MGYFLLSSRSELARKVVAVDVVLTWVRFSLRKIESSFKEM